MPTIHLTKSSLDGIAPGSKDEVYWDQSLPGFGVKVTPKGRKVFIVMYRTRDGSARLRKYTIGPYGQTTLAMARMAAQKILAARLDGKDPALEKRQARQRSVVDRVDLVAEEFLDRQVSGKRKAGETRRVLEREMISRWGQRSIHEIRKRDIVKALDEIVDRGAPGTANRAFKQMRAFFNWCVRRDLLEKSPCAGLAAPAPQVARDRLLDDEELAAVILAARRIGYPYGSIVEFLCLTGQRREEVAQMTWAELRLDRKTWTLDGNRTKNGKPHVVHLSQEARDLIASLPRTGDLVFSPTGRRFQNYTKAKRALDKFSGVDGWVLHDLRRTVVSGMARLGVAPHVADRILNHQSGTISGVAAVYQRHEFMEERRAALDLWGAHVAAILRKRVTESRGSRTNRLVMAT